MGIDMFWFRRPFIRRSGVPAVRRAGVLLPRAGIVLRALRRLFRRRRRPEPGEPALKREGLPAGYRPHRSQAPGGGVVGWSRPMSAAELADDLARREPQRRPSWLDRRPR